MTKKTKRTGEQEVALYIEKTDHPLKDEIIALRKIILASDAAITEHIKWNAPSFCVNEEDRFTFKLILTPPKKPTAESAEDAEKQNFQRKPPRSPRSLRSKRAFFGRVNTTDAVEIVFHRGAKAKAMPSERLIEDPDGLLKWATNDRAVATFSNMTDIQNKELALIAILNEWQKASA